ADTGPYEIRPANYRDRLKLVDGTFQTIRGEVRSGAHVVIESQLDPVKSYLDGDVFTNAVLMAPRTSAPYTGTRWELRLNDTGAWSLFNQGYEERLLDGGGGVLKLGKGGGNADGPLDRVSEWLVFRDFVGFRFRPVGVESGWLSHIDGKAAILRRGMPIGLFCYWNVYPHLQSG
ncbi:MAG: hypothetical protein ABI832_21215, partial [bacterium]